MRLLAAILTLASVCSSCTHRAPTTVAGSPAPALDDILHTNASAVLCLHMPELKSKGLKVTEALQLLNKNIQALVGGDPRGEIVISRAHPSHDHGNRVMEYNLRADTLVEQIHQLAMGNACHWFITDNGYLIFRTWHKPQYHEPSPDLIEALGGKSD